MDTIRNTDTIDQLNSFLRGELSAVETYRQALQKLTNTVHRSILLECSRSHEQRVQALTQAILERGGVPATSSGAWGTFAKLVESSAAAFGEKSAIAALEEGEDHGINDYQRDLSDLDPSLRHLLEVTIIPEQRRTHDAIRNIKRQLAA
ncbi:MAG: DUF2383 domain-containing protein [Polyangiaceae bacterium]